MIQPLIRILDDDEEFLDAMSFVFRTEGWSVATYQRAADLLTELDDRPGCVILDVRMPEVSGPEVQHRLSELQSTLPIIFLTGHGTLDLAVQVFRKGAFDFLQKPVQKELLVSTVQRAIEADQVRRQENHKHSPLGLYQQLTDREKEIVRDVAQGLSNKAIAEHFGISERTVEAHRSAAMRKLGVKRPQEVAQLLSLLRRENQIV